MSLEAAILELAAALKENTEELKFLTSAARDGATKNSARASTKQAEETGEKTATRSRSTGRATKEKVPTVKEISDATKTFLDVSDEGEYEDRKDIVKRIVERFKSKKMSEIDEKFRAEALNMLKVAAAGDDPFDGEDGNGDEEDLT